jgi:neutral/alkaline ceramidase-like enzyme
MSRIRLIAWIMVAVIALPAGAELRIGAASTAINPADGVYLGGYSEKRQCTGVHDDLYAKAIVFDDGDTAVALVVLDSVGTQYDTIQKIRRQASAGVKNIALPAERVIVVSTHTHCSPDTIGIYGPDDTTTGRDPGYMESLVTKAAAQVVRAAQGLQPATIRCAVAQGGDWAVNDSEPGDVVRDITVLQCLDADGKTVATLTSYACHPTVLDGDTTLASSDWVGAFYSGMSDALPGEHLYLQGSIGGWIQPVTPERSFSLAAQYGTDLAQRALAALESTQPLEGTNVRFANRVFAMPNQSELYKQISVAGLVPRPLGETIETEVAWFSVGNAQFATHPGETAPEYTRATRKLMDTEPKIVLGLGLDQLGYILKQSFFDNRDTIPHAPYLTTVSPGPDAGPSMMAALETIIP